VPAWSAAWTGPFHKPVLMLGGQERFWFSLHTLALHLGKCVSAHFNWIYPHLKGFIPILYPATGKGKKMLLQLFSLFFVSMPFLKDSEPASI